LQTKSSITKTTLSRTAIQRLALVAMKKKTSSKMTIYCSTTARTIRFAALKYRTTHFSHRKDNSTS